MNEELIISGRENLMVDPQLHIWHWPIPLYLFLGGLAAGVCSLQHSTISWGRKRNIRTAVRKVPFIAPILLDHRPCSPLF